MAEELPFFVYGTLRRGQGNYRILQGYTAHEVSARLPGAQLYDLGSFPVAVDGAGTVLGELMTIRPGAYYALMQRLDLLEGVDMQNPGEGLYRRVVRTVHTGGGKDKQAWVYLGDRVYLRDAVCIAQGDWVRYRQEAQQS